MGSSYMVDIRKSLDQEDDSSMPSRSPEPSWGDKHETDMITEHLQKRKRSMHAMGTQGRRVNSAWVSQESPLGEQTRRL